MILVRQFLEPLSPSGFVCVVILYCHIFLYLTKSFGKVPLTQRKYYMFRTAIKIVL